MEKQINKMKINKSIKIKYGFANNNSEHITQN